MYKGFPIEILLDKAHIQVVLQLIIELACGI